MSEVYCFMHTRKQQRTTQRSIAIHNANSLTTTLSVSSTLPSPLTLFTSGIDPLSTIMKSWNPQIALVKDSKSRIGHHFVNYTACLFHHPFTFYPLLPSFFSFKLKQPSFQSMAQPTPPYYNRCRNYKNLLPKSMLGELGGLTTPPTSSHNSDGSKSRNKVVWLLQFFRWKTKRLLTVFTASYSQ